MNNEQVRQAATATAHAIKHIFDDVEATHNRAIEIKYPETLEIRTVEGYTFTFRFSDLLK